jgi:hypothetical protein
MLIIVIFGIVYQPVHLKSEPIGTLSQSEHWHAGIYGLSIKFQNSVPMGTLFLKCTDRCTFSKVYRHAFLYTTIATQWSNDISIGGEQGMPTLNNQQHLHKHTKTLCFF